MSKNDFLNTDVISLLSNAKITFSRGGAADLKKVCRSRTTTCTQLVYRHNCFIWPNLYNPDDKILKFLLNVSTI